MHANERGVATTAVFFILTSVLRAVRSVGELSEPVLSKFEQLAEKHSIGLAFLFSFPTYSTSKASHPFNRTQLHFLDTMKPLNK